MPFPPSPEDRPDPLENMPAMRARIPDHIARGEISTGVIVVTGGTEYVLDFVRNLPRPNAIVARVVLPHLVMPQFIEALATNIELFRQRYGELPGQPSPVVTQPVAGAPNASGLVTQSPNVPPLGPSTEPSADSHVESPSGSQPTPTGDGNATGTPSQAHLPPGAQPKPDANHVRRQNPQEVYDDLKLRDEILSGAYANAVMIGHGPYEFSFDFITNFYPQSAVSCRVYLASGHILRLLESLRASWEQLRPRLSQGYPPPNPPQPPPPSR